MFLYGKFLYSRSFVCAAVGAAATSVVAATALSAMGANNVTISNGGLSVTFNLAWGAVVTGISNTNVGNGLNIVDSHDVGRELQTDQFLYQNIGGTPQLIFNPTQAGAGGSQPYYQHPNGSAIPEAGSPVASWSASGNQFQAVVTPLDYDTGNPTDWVYVENVSINSQGIANFQYTCYDYQPGTYSISTEVPTLYTDLTNAFMYPASNGTAQTVTGSPSWPQFVTSKGWIGNIDTGNNLGVFYTTQAGLPENYGTFPGAAVSDAPPLGKTSAVEHGLMVSPGTILSSRFSVAVSTQQNGPTLMAEQPPAISSTSTSIISNGAFSTNAAAYTAPPGYSTVGGNPGAPAGWTSSGGSSGVNGSDTGFYGSIGFQPFAPTSTAGVSDFSFLQGRGTLISQLVTTTVGKSYTLAFDAAQRSGNTTASLEAVLTNPTNGGLVVNLEPAITDTGFTPFFLNFTADSGSTEIEFLNNSAAGVDDTVDVSNISLAATAVPEPAALAIFALGGIVLVMVNRKRKTWV